MFTNHLSIVAALLVASTATLAAPSISHAGAIRPVAGTDIALSNDSNTYAIPFRGGEVARITLSGDGDTDLDLYVYDSEGRLITKDIGLTDDASVSFYVPEGQVCTVKVVNLGEVYNRFVLATN